MAEPQVARTAPGEPLRSALRRTLGSAVAFVYGVLALGIAVVTLKFTAEALGEPTGLATSLGVLIALIVAYRGPGGRDVAALGIAGGLAGLVILSEVFHDHDEPVSEGPAIGSLRTLITAQALYREGDKDKNGVLEYCPVLGPASDPRSLAGLGLVDGVLGRGTKQGYRFKILRADLSTWSATAEPVRPGELRRPLRYFFIDESGVVRFATDRTATSLDSAIGG